MAEHRERFPRVVVGVDGSDHAGAALQWATAEAVRRGAVVRLVHAMGPPSLVPTGKASARFHPSDEMRSRANALLAEAREYVVGLHPDVETETVATSEDGPRALLHQSRPHDLLVVGTRGLGPVAAVLVGSVSVRVAARAPCPVVVVPHDLGRPATTCLQRIVVGVSFSRDARRVLKLAMDLTGETRGELVVATSWEMPQSSGYQFEVTGSGHQSLEEMFDRQSEQLVDGLLTELSQARGAVDIKVSVVRTRSDPVDGLLRVAEGADAIVVGSSGHGTVLGWLLSSVSQGLLHRSHIPIVVLPKHGAQD
ncbi:universal stress protein [Nocardiopsis salina]|uniref:universal stress protein n=1 Tax=Nocardiopsis salina TaxID=245836 RepID=UPI000477B45D|nr:universal stress protein [Nocardiopsis salina]